jgi:hypothetical protein
MSGLELGCWRASLTTAVHELQSAASPSGLSHLRQEREWHSFGSGGLRTENVRVESSS